MGKYRVLKAHDGLEVGQIVFRPLLPSIEECLRLGLWEEIPDKPKTAKTTPKREVKPKAKEIIGKDSKAPKKGLKTANRA